ncbi:MULTISPECIES: RDD family protein [Streptomyces]|uniref:RDD family protein n=2 Tax=Streptomyces TaxID=1883 RepID=UPI000A398365|nr:RDD family protein [Streptomyces glaucescens]
MSAPTPAPGDDRPREGYYPDPSIPGYVRYWNGAAWVPGTSRPAPADGEPLAPPPGVRPDRSAAASVEETGPHFFDEDPADEPEPAAQEPAPAWGADRSHQSGFGGDPDRRVSWGSPQGADPRTSADGSPDPRAARPDGAAATPPAASGADAEQAAAASGSTFVFRRPVPDARGAQGDPPAGGAGLGAGAAGPAAAGFGPAAGAAASGPAFGPAARAGTGRDEGTMTFRAVGPRATASDTTASGAAAPSAPAAQAPSAQSAPAQAASAAAGPQQQPAAGFPQRTPQVPQQAVAATPVTTGPGGGQSSWAQQVHQLAGASSTAADEQPVAPWKPPVEDVFQAAARRQASARPAGLGKRLAARLIDTVVVAGVTAVAAVPLGGKALDHIQDKVDQAKLSGQTVTVWLLDGTTSTYLGIILAVLLVFGALYEALPTAKWGRTPGKKLLGLEVRDIEAHEPPSFGAALRRWLVYSVSGLLFVGVVGVLWCLWDKPWRQCWHDKAARTFVAA